MATATWTQTAIKTEARLSGRLVLGDVSPARSGATTVYELDGVKVGRRGVTFPFPLELAPGRFAWVELKLPAGKLVKPLVAVLASSDGVVSARIVHCFPEHQRALDAHLASASGY